MRCFIVDHIPCWLFVEDEAIEVAVVLLLVLLVCGVECNDDLFSIMFPSPPLPGMIIFCTCPMVNIPQEPLLAHPDADTAAPPPPAVAPAVAPAAVADALWST